MYSYNKYLYNVATLCCIVFGVSANSKSIVQEYMYTCRESVLHRKLRNAATADKREDYIGSNRWPETSKFFTRFRLFKRTSTRINSM